MTGQNGSMMSLNVLQFLSALGVPHLRVCKEEKITIRSHTAVKCNIINVQEHEFYLHSTIEGPGQQP